MEKALRRPPRCSGPNIRGPRLCRRTYGLVHRTMPNAWTSFRCPSRGQGILAQRAAWLVLDDVGLARESLLSGATLVRCSHGPVGRLRMAPASPNGPQGRGYNTYLLNRATRAGRRLSWAVNASIALNVGGLI